MDGARESGARAVAAACLFAVWLWPATFAAETVVVGSKNFVESRLLAEIFAQLLEERTTLTVERRLNLAGTQVCFEALRTGAIDIYPEYTGTGLATILGESPGGGASEVLNRVRGEFRERFDLWWLPPLGFENAYELAVTSSVAEQHGLRTISDLARVSRQLSAGLGYEFIERDDGLRGLKRAYGLEFADVRALQQALKVQAAANGEIDCLDVYTTDGWLLVHDLRVLEDDLEFFPPYQAAPLVRGETLREHPEIGNVLALLADGIDEKTMQGLNLRVQELREPVETVARVALEGLGLIGERQAAVPSNQNRTLVGYMWQQRATLLRRTLEHLGLTSLALLGGVLVAVPLALFLEGRRRIAEPVIRLVGITQTVPSIALLAFMIPLFGVGALPALVALWIYSVFPILRNGFTGLRDASPSAVEAATALGMTRGQVLGRVRLSLAVPVILAGVRTSAVLTVGTATLAAFIGAGGLGVPIVAGLQMVDSIRILSGALPAATLALLVDAALALAERRLRPPGLP